MTKQNMAARARIFLEEARQLRIRIDSFETEMRRDIRDGIPPERSAMRTLSDGIHSAIQEAADALGGDE